jgi:hypothetical protein
MVFRKQVSLNYTEGMLPINIVTDGCLTGILGLVSQGSDWRIAPIVAFFSAKLNSASAKLPSTQD